MSLKKLKAQAAQAHETAQGRDDAFKIRVAQQQFMNHHGPLFAAAARRSASPEGAVGGDVLAKPAEDSKKLAVAIAAKLLGKPESEVVAADARPYRQDAAAFVASMWSSGADCDIDAAAAAIAGAVRHADAGLDANPFDSLRITGDASLAMTAAGVAAQVLKQVMVYDFRQERGSLMGRLVSAVTGTAAAATRDMLHADATDDDRRTLLQTVARQLSAIMESCYERKSREVVAALAPLGEAERLGFYRDRDPVAEILESFRDWSVCFAGFAVAAAREMTGAARSGSLKETTP
jgi:hypothetical protein